jgi:hypothetical protein
MIGRSVRNKSLLLSRRLKKKEAIPSCKRFSFGVQIIIISTKNVVKSMVISLLITMLFRSLIVSVIIKVVLIGISFRNNRLNRTIKSKTFHLSWGE